MSGALSYEPDRYEIPIQSSSVSRLYVEGGCDLHISGDEDEMMVRIAGAIAVVMENPRALVDLGDEAAAPPAFGKILVSRSGLCNERRLEVLFDPGVRFWIDSSPRREAWGPAGSKGLVVICMPGGELALWFGRRAPARAPAATENCPAQL